MKTFNTAKLLSWYRNQARELPWRQTSDPYAIWVSEIMLQQTRVATVIPYYQQWMETFPTLEDLARADEEEVLALWEGLGYYRRARYLHQAAKELLKTQEGKIPDQPRLLKELPGIGPYTAAAVASIAFGRDAAALDGNIRRVLTRIYDISTPISDPAAENELQQLAENNLPSGQAGDYNQALMELGAVICTPRSPDCPICPLAKDCLAFQSGIQEDRPVRKTSSPVPHHQVAAAVIQEADQVLIAKRPAEGLLGGMWEYPGGKQEDGESLEQALRREIQEELGVSIQVGKKIALHRHAYTHYKITLHAFQCRLLSADVQLHYHTSWTWAPIRELSSYPMGKLDRLISDQLIQDLDADS